MHILAHERINALPLWRHRISISPLSGGRTNLNFMVEDGCENFVVRLGEDIPAHHVLRFNELAASRAAFEAGISPEVVYAENGLSVMRYIHSHTLSESDIAKPQYLPRVVELMRRCHQEMPQYLRGPALMFWVFHVIRDYAATLVERGSPYATKMPEYLKIAESLEAAIGPITPVFGHNDMMAANILDDGARLWLIDWDYAGYNSPLFDLGGLAGNNQLSQAQEAAMLELYFQTPPDAALLARYNAMKCASLMREVMWSMVSELISGLDIDYASYTAENIARFEQAHANLKQG